jgi:energy-coupling factor transport system ATP-binding protein
MMNIYNIENFTFEYPDMSSEQDGVYLPASLNNIHLKVASGEFVVIAGASGSGKTTLLKHMKTCLAPAGRTSGNISFMGQQLSQTEGRCQAENIGFVMQEVDAQLVTDKVWHELAFGLESLGYDNSFIRRRVAEMCSFFGLNDIFHKKVNELSGGQKQMVNLASVMALSPKVLILDEPTSQLDPIAMREFMSCIGRINRELGTTIIMTEHRLEELWTYADRLVVMEQGSIVYDGEVRGGMAHMEKLNMPAALEIYNGLNDSYNTELPVTILEGRNWLREYDKSHDKSTEFMEKAPLDNDVIMNISDICFRYEGEDRDVLSKLSLKIMRNEILAINGSNGSGKSTLLSIMAGVRKSYRGKVRIKSKTKSGIGLLPQDPKTLFTRNTVRAELRDRISEEEAVNIVKLCKLEKLLDRHPYDLSGGEQERLALAMVLMNKPDILLMDEPTKGMDGGYKKQFRQILQNLKEKGCTIIIVSHDIEFCAETADRTALMFDGEIATISDTRSFFAGNEFYTTAAARIAKDIVPGAVTVEDIVRSYRGGDYDGKDKNEDDVKKADIKIGGGNVNKVDIDKQDDDSNKSHIDDNTDSDINIDKIVINSVKKQFTCSGKRIVVLLASACVMIYCFIKTVSQSDLTQLISGRAITHEGGSYLIMYGIFIAAIIIFLIALKPVGVKYDEQIELENIHGKAEPSRICRRKSGNVIDIRRIVLSAIMIVIAIPLTIWFGIEKLGDRKYYFISLLVLLEAMLPFFAAFESKKVKARDIVTIAVMCAIAVAGRTAFFMIPNFNPVMAVVIICAVAYGPEAGFITGAITMLTSNMIFGQGPWTPWQMFSMGLLGYVAGLFYYNSRIRSRWMTKLSLCIFGGLSCIIIYGGIMNPASVIMWQPSPNKSMIIAAYVTGFPFDVVEGLATAVFLWLMARPMLEKLDRIKKKYNLFSGSGAMA